jgi:hypothetical protein
LRAVPRSGNQALRALGLVGLALLGRPAGAADRSTEHEFWPEINAYVNLDERSRLLFAAAATRATEGTLDDGKLAFQKAQFTFNVDYTLAPRLRRDVPQAEWSKNRLLWTRLGFEYGSSGSSGSDAFRSYTGIAELNSRFPLDHDVWLTNRLRADFRHINGEPSQRYRIRLGAEWDTVAFDHPYAPYASVETLYDTRYDKWSRVTLKAGVETPIAADWRIEPYLALQLNRPDEVLSRVLGLGLTLKVYFD